MPQPNLIWKTKFFSKQRVNFKRKTIMAIAKELLDILACPKCKEPVELNKEGNGLVCGTCRLVYEIRDDIPIMLIDEAKPLKD